MILVDSFSLLPCAGSFAMENSTTQIHDWMTENVGLVFVWSSGPSLSKGGYRYPVDSAIDFPTYKIRCDLSIR